MHFVAICQDKEGAAAVRVENRPAHVEFLKGNAASIPIAGPFLNEAGDDMIGSMLIVEAYSEADVRSPLSQDPYAKAGLFASVDVRPWKWTVGAPEAS